MTAKLEQQRDTTALRDFDMMMESKGEEKNSLSSFQLRSAWINDLTRLTSDNAAFTVLVGFIGQSGGDQKR